MARIEPYVYGYARKTVHPFQPFRTLKTITLTPFPILCLLRPTAYDTHPDALPEEAPAHLYNDRRQGVADEPDESSVCVVQ